MKISNCSFARHGIISSGSVGGADTGSEYTVQLFCIRDAIKQLQCCIIIDGDGRRADGDVVAQD
jgi:hypothetical protein